MPVQNRRISSIFLIAVVPLLLGACSSDGGSATADPTARGTDAGGQDGVQVSLVKFAFDPDPLQIKAGDTVTWTNEDDILHTVTSGQPQEQGVPGVSANKDSVPDGLFDQPLEFEDTFSFTFEETGEITYFCNIHPGMTGSIVVE